MPYKSCLTRRRNPDESPCHLSPDQALSPETRPEYAPDGERPPGRGVLAIASRDARVVEDAIRFSKSPGISRDFGSKPTVSRTGKSTLIPRGTHGYRETRDKPRTPLPQENKPESVPDGKRIWKINSYNFCRTPVYESGPRRTQVKPIACVRHRTVFPRTPPRELLPN